jgi:IPT/TIG domain-containing protein
MSLRQKVLHTAQALTTGDRYGSVLSLFVSQLQFNRRSLACQSLALTLLLGVAFQPATVQAQSKKSVPHIASLSPTSGPIDTLVTITGTSFGSTQSSSKVTFQQNIATIERWSATSIVVQVPTGATTGNVVVTVGGRASNGVTFTVSVSVPAPSITSLSPTSGQDGASVTIAGANFGTAQGTVSFNGTLAPVTSWNSSAIVVTVPTGATSGNVIVTAGEVASNGVNFTVLPPSSSGYTMVSTTSPATATPITVLVPNSYSSSVPTPLVIYFHGGGETQTAILTGLLDQYGVTSALINAGYIVAGSASTGIYEYGAQPALDDYVDLYNYVVANYNIGTVLFLSQSDGGLAGLNLFTQWTIPNVVAWAGIFPACNLGWGYALPGAPAYIDPTYGITGANGQTYTNLTTGYDPALKPGLAFRNAYLRFYASPEDTVILKVDNSDVIAAHAASSTLESTVVVCTGDHGDPSCFQPADIVAFYQRALASPPPLSGLVP